MANPVTATAPGWCVDCNGRINVGDLFIWGRTRGARAHYNEADCGRSNDAAVHPMDAQPEQPIVVRTWSERQQAVFNAGILTLDNIIIDAKAGSGKTTVLEELAKRLTNTFPSKSIVAMAFNTKIATELSTRMPKTVITSTFHSAWLKALTASLGRKPRIEGNKVRQIAREMVRGGNLDRETADKYLKGAIKLVAAAKSAGVGECVENTIEVWTDLIDRFDVQFDGTDESTGIQLAMHLLDESNKDTTIVDFDDMLYLPCILNIVGTQYNVVMVDEAQDFNPVQRRLLHRMLTPTGRLIAVGDPNQSIYGFRGAAYDSMDCIKEEFNCVELPLDISYRCPQEVVKLAQSIVPTIQAHESAPAGKVTRHSAFSLHDFKSTDAVICRNTAPLVTLAYRCFAAKVPCRVLGREIGEGLISLIKQMHAVDLQDLQERLDSYRSIEIPRLTARMQEGKAQALDDKMSSIDAAIAGLIGGRSIQDLIYSIEEMFAPKPDGMLTLSTIHKAKGAEWPHVFILDAHLMPSKFAKSEEQRQQESNITYVAYTRAKEELSFIDTASIS